MSEKKLADIRLRLATPSDAQGCLEIYGPVIEDTAASFEVKVPSAGEFGKRITSTLETYPWLVAESQGQMAGYAYACRHRERHAYQWSLEVSSYVRPIFHRLGIGRRLYQCLLTCLKYQGFRNAYAGITLPNDPSVGFHESFGFKPVGIYPHIGYKFEAWHDVGWWERAISGRMLPDSPMAPIPLPRCREQVNMLVADYNTRV